jgi:hypothetical protein
MRPRSQMTLAIPWEFGTRIDQLATIATDMLRDLSREKRAFEQRWKRTEGQITDLLKVRDAIGFDLIDAVGADVQLPSAFCARLPGEDDADFLVLPRVLGSRRELP